MLPDLTPPVKYSAAWKCGLFANIELMIEPDLLLCRLGQLGEHRTPGLPSSHVRAVGRSLRCGLSGDSLAAFVLPGPGAGGWHAGVATLQAGGIPGLAG